MREQNTSELIAGIDIGSHALRMKIVEINQMAEIKILELLRNPVSLGSDTYTMGKVSFDTVDHTCDILQGFKRLMNDYNIKTYRAVATSAIREAENRDYIVDQIKLKTGLEIDVISNAEERSLTYKAIRDNLPDVIKMRNESLMIVTVGSGSIEISIYIQDNLTFSQNIRLGSLRLREFLAGLEGRTLQFSKILEEYIDSNIDRLKDFIGIDKCKYFIALGGEIRTISRICNQTRVFEELKYIDKDSFLHLYNHLVNKSTQSIIKEYQVSPERANVLVPSMMIFKRFLEMSKAEGMHAPLISLRDGIIADIIDSKFNTIRKKVFQNDIISYARFLGQRYKYDQKHAQDVEEKSLFLFDQLKVLHGLGNKERQLLQLAAILHDIGKFTNLTKHYIHSYDIIIATEIVGISQEELEVIANVARYHSQMTPRYSHENFAKLSEKNRVIVAKLVAIIRMADALDRSHTQKIDRLNLSIDEKQIIIRGESERDTLLEEWTFETKSDFFQEVFGVKTKLKIKRKIGP